MKVNETVRFGDVALESACSRVGCVFQHNEVAGIECSRVPFIVTKVPASIARTLRRDKTCVRLL